MFLCLVHEQELQHQDDKRQERQFLYGLIQVLNKRFVEAGPKVCIKLLYQKKEMSKCPNYGKRICNGRYYLKIS